HRAADRRAPCAPPQRRAAPPLHDRHLPRRARDRGAVYLRARPHHACGAVRELKFGRLQQAISRAFEVAKELPEAPPELDDKSLNYHLKIAGFQWLLRGGGRALNQLEHGLITYLHRDIPRAARHCPWKQLPALDHTELSTEFSLG